MLNQLRRRNPERLRHGTNKLHQASVVKVLERNSSNHRRLNRSTITSIQNDRCSSNARLLGRIFTMHNFRKHAYCVRPIRARKLRNFS